MHMQRPLRACILKVLSISVISCRPYLGLTQGRVITGLALVTVGLLSRQSEASLELLLSLLQLYSAVLYHICCLIILVLQ